MSHGSIGRWLAALGLAWAAVPPPASAQLRPVPANLAYSVAAVRLTESTPASGRTGPPTERLAAFHKTVVLTDEAVPNSAAFTYLTRRFTYTERNFLAKFMPIVHGGDKIARCDLAREVRVENSPGGVVAEALLADRRIHTEITSLFRGRGADAPEGVVLYTIQADAPTPGSHMPVEASRVSVVITANDDGVRTCEIKRISGLEIKKGVATYRGGEEQIPVAVRSSGNLELSSEGALRATFPDGKGHILVAFAKTPERAIELTRTDAGAAVRQVSEYYRQLESINRVDTPEPAINQAFTHALRTLEYSWIEPIGWLECIHHWFSLWHMQAAAGAEWVGQQDRSRACTLAHANRLNAEGAIPQLSPSGHVHRDFGGSNQYWAWQVRHYWRFTADRAFAKEVGPVLNKVIAQTVREYDKDENGLLAWGLQIGNQEDYVATPYDGTSPSIEGINMLLTGAELAHGIGDAVAAERYGGQAARTRALLREKLWIPELGRYAFFIDPLGRRRLDGQYHTLAYPVLWGLTDPLDSYTTLRHLRDRLTGEGGEVFCSNNFPNHVLGTWGMQAGAAQQPWAAWALSAAGQFEEAYRPLAAAARWVMNADHRGAWPEVATESTPAYFSPPAGLFIASVVEALFGLKPDLPNRVLQVSPSFPSHWPAARANLADYRADYRRDGNHIEYLVESNAVLERQFTWHLPPCRITRVLIDGTQAAYSVEPAVNAVRLRIATPAATSTQLVIDFEPLEVVMTAPASLAEGEPIRIELTGAEITAVDDRCGLLSGWNTVAPERFEARLRDRLLAGFRGYGRLGQLTFSRRTFFLQCTPHNACAFWKPVDIAVLPPLEVAPGLGDRGQDSVRVGPDQTSLVFDLTVRNNTSERLRETARLSLAGGEYPLKLNLPPRSQDTVRVEVPAPMVGLLAPGDNRMVLTVPGRATSIETHIAVVDPFVRLEPLSRAVTAGTEHIPLDATHMIADTEWRKLRAFPAYPHMPWAGSRPPLEALSGQETMGCPGLPLVDFRLPDRRFVPVAFKIGRPAYTLDLNARRCRKLFLLVVPFLDNHDLFTDVGRITVRSPEDLVHSRTLRFPGDLDWWSPPAVVGDFATVGREHRDRHGLLPQLAAGPSDWEEARAPAFPQPRYWSASPHITTASSVLSVVEIDLERFVEVASLTLESLGADPAFGLVAVTALTADGQPQLAESPWNPPAAFRQPRILFSFERNPDLTDWKIEGQAFSVSSVPGLFTAETLNSLGAAGEAATGRATSPAFTPGPNDRTLLIQLHGGLSRSENGVGLLALDVVDARDGRRLHRISPRGTHGLCWERIDLRPWAGRAIQLQLTDENTDPAFAWLGIAAVRIVCE